MSHEDREADENSREGVLQKEKITELMILDKETFDNVVKMMLRED